jgi:hypothetical protein
MVSSYERVDRAVLIGTAEDLVGGASTIGD